MKPNQLQAFVAVASQLSIRGAARALGLSQPAVTRIVRELERELGAPLVERNVRGVQLTPFGVAFAPRARQLLEDMRRARDEIAQIRDGVRGRVALAVSTSIAMTLLPPAFKAFHAQQPSVDVNFSEAVLPTMLPQLLDGSLDFAVAHVVPSTLGTAFDSIDLFPVQLVAGVRRRHPLRKARTLGALHEAEWILPGDGGPDRPGNASLLSTLKLPPTVRLIQGQSVTVALGLVAHLDLVGLFVEPLADLAFKHHGIVRLDLDEPLPTLRVCVLSRSGRTLTPAAQAFVACIRDAAQAP